MSSTEAHEVKEKGDEAGENEVVFLAPECPVEKVTVYPDRAEVCRRVEGSLSAGLNQVVIKKLPEMVDSDSIRVEGTGTATIIEVVFHSESVAKSESDMSHRERELKAETDFLLKQNDELQSEIDILKKRWELLDNFASTASKGKADKEAQAFDLNEGFFTGMTAFLQLYSDEGNMLEKKRMELVKRKELVSEKIDANLENKNKLREEKETTHELKKCVIVVECKAECKVSLLVSYVTSAASWKPSYDIRMFTAEDNLKITYYGQIKQATGEDWTDAKLYLSTAQPSIGGEVPELYTAELRLRKPPSTSARMAKKSYRFTGEFLASASKSLRSYDVGDELECCGLAMAAPMVQYAEAEVGEGVATTMYEIARRSTIPSDNVEHKVTVGIVDIKPKISYTSVPQRVPHAFILAKVTNSSPYTFLQGETSIFLDNTFVGKASMKDVYPMEEFECSLGVDPAVKITYKPLKKYRASSGLISKVLSNTHEQVIEVKNTHDYGIEILVTDQLPRSADDRIKVHLVEPQIDFKHPEKSKDKEVSLNKSNNLEWNLEVKKQETKEITLKYIVDHPASFNIYTNENKA